MYVDTHTHFDIVMKKWRCLEKNLLDGLKNKNIFHAVQVSIAVESFKWAYDFAKRYKDRGIFFTLGINPSSEAGDAQLSELDRFTAVAMKEEPRLLFGIGECGLDYFRMRQPLEMQESSFRRQIYLAKKYKKPLIIHSRDAADATISILKESGPVWGIMHCFQGDSRTAKQYLDLGFYISFAGNVTYQKARELHDAAAYVPSDRILAETDAPFLTPVPLRGKNNRTENVVHTYDFLAELRKEPLDSLQLNILENFGRIVNGNI